MVFFHAMQPLFFQCDFPLAARYLIENPSLQIKKIPFFCLVSCSVELDCNTSFFSVPSTKRLTGLFWFFVHKVIFQHWYVGNQSQPQMAKFQQSRRTTQRKSWNTKIQKRRSILTLKTSWRIWAGQLIRQANAKLNPIKPNNFIFCKQNQDMKKRAKVRVILCALWLMGFVVNYENMNWMLTSGSARLSQSGWVSEVTSLSFINVYGPKKTDEILNISPISGGTLLLHWQGWSLTQLSHRCNVRFASFASEF